MRRNYIRTNRNRDKRDSLGMPPNLEDSRRRLFHEAFYMLLCGSRIYWRKLYHSYPSIDLGADCNHVVEHRYFSLLEVGKQYACHPNRRFRHVILLAIYTLSLLEWYKNSMAMLTFPRSGSAVATPFDISDCMTPNMAINKAA